MYSKLTFFAISLFCLKFCYGQTFIKGYIHDSLNNKIMVYEPINGFCNTTLAIPKWEIKTDKKGYFHYSLNISSPNMVTVRIGLRPIWIFIEPGDTIEITANLNKFTTTSPNNGIVFKGKNAAGNEYFNQFNYLPGTKLGHFEQIVNDSLKFHKTHDFKAIDYALNIQTAHFDTLLKSGKITKTFYDFVVPGIKQDLIGREINYFIFHQKTESFQEGIAFANKIYEKYPVSIDVIKHSLFNSMIAFDYYFTKAARFYSSPYLADSIIISDKSKNIFINKNLVCWLYAPKNVQEVLWPLNLINLKRLFADSYSEKDVKSFLTLCPNSPLKKYLHPPYFGNLIYKTNYKDIDSSLIKIMPLPQATNLNDFIRNNFKGKKLFVDFWASWCAPCKQEFQFNVPLDSFCKKNNIIRLYISFDQPVTKNAMNKSIYAYDLKGYHTTVNDSLFSDIINIFYGKEAFSIPRYLLINENGEVINSNAPRPSSENELFNVMKRDFKLPN